MGNTNTTRSVFKSFGSISVVTLFVLGLAQGCTNRPVTNTTAGEGIVRTEPATKADVKPVKNKIKTGPKTWENTGTKIAKNTEKHTRTKPIPVPVPVKKSGKDRSWETESSGDVKGADGSLAFGRSGGSRGRTPPAMAKAAPSGSATGASGFGSGSGGLGGGASGPRVAAEAAAADSAPARSFRESKEVRPLFKSDKYEKYQSQSASDLLTAGSFDDADDIQVFQKFWDNNELSRSSLLNESRISNWGKAYKKADTRKHSTLQLAFVVDTTGSMGDELEYLKDEFKTIVAEINRSYPGVKKEYAFIAYRDQSDEYVTRGLNFTEDVDDVQAFIRNQSAGGGGDYPEAVHTALEEAYSRLTWNSNGDTARMLFHIADAPAHTEDMDSTFRSVEKLSDAGINVFPVAASGVLDVAEAMMRATALLTGGKYIFLTDDSGIGNAHAAPTHPCYDVEKLKNVMVRVIKDRISGSRSFPVAKNVIRHGGDRTAGYCRTNNQVVGQW